MAERQPTSRRSGTDSQSPSRRSGTGAQSGPRRNDVVRCDQCGEYYSVTYKRCPFCNERPGQGRNGGRRVANTRGGGYGRPVNPIQVVALVISLVLIIAALFIVFTKLLPLFTKDQEGGSSASGSQSTSIGSSSAVTPPDDTDPSGSGGSQSEPPDPVPDPTPVTVSSLTLNKSDITLQPNEEFEFIVKVDPADATVTWSSSDESVLKVNQDGTVVNVNTTGDKIKVTVTASAGDKSAQCSVFCRGSGTSSSGSTGGQSESTGSTGGSTGNAGNTGTIAPNTPATIVNAESGLNIRSGPGTEYDVVASASNGAKITVLEETNGWCKFDYGGGKFGYVSKDYVSVD